MQIKIKTKAEVRKGIHKKRSQVHTFPIIDRTPFFGVIKLQDDPLLVQQKMRDEG